MTFCQLLLFFNLAIVTCIAAIAFKFRKPIMMLAQLGGRMLQASSPLAGGAGAPNRSDGSDTSDDIDPLRRTDTALPEESSDDEEEDLPVFGFVNKSTETNHDDGAALHKRQSLDFKE